MGHYTPDTRGWGGEGRGKVSWGGDDDAAGSHRMGSTPQLQEGSGGGRGGGTGTLGRVLMMVPLIKFCGPSSPAYKRVVKGEGGQGCGCQG